MNDAKLSSEIQAMVAIEQVLTPLHEEERGRVLRWAVDRYKVGVTWDRTAGAAVDGGDDELGHEDFSGEGAVALTAKHETFAEFYAAADPKTEAERVLVAAYWFTEREGWTDLQSRPLNQELRHLGHAVSHMPKAFSSLTDRKPQFIVQLRKSGKSKQATVRYKLTMEGRNAVERMLTGGSAQQ